MMVFARDEGDASWPLVLRKYDEADGVALRAFAQTLFGTSPIGTA